MPHRRAGARLSALPNRRRFSAELGYASNAPMIDSREGTEMGWINTFRSSDAGEPADLWNEAITNGAPHDAHQAIRSVTENPAAPVGRPDADCGGNKASTDIASSAL